MAQGKLCSLFSIILHRNGLQIAPAGKGVRTNGGHSAGNGQGGDAGASISAAHRHDKGVVANGLQATGQHQFSNLA